MMKNVCLQYKNFFTENLVPGLSQVILAISSKPHLSEPSICYLVNIFKSPEYVPTMLNTQKTECFKFANCKNMFRINKHWHKVHCCLCLAVPGTADKPGAGYAAHVWTEESGLEWNLHSHPGGRPRHARLQSGRCLRTLQNG